MQHVFFFHHVAVIFLRGFERFATGWNVLTSHHGPAATHATTLVRLLLRTVSRLSVTEPKTESQRSRAGQRGAGSSCTSGCSSVGGHLRKVWLWLLLPTEKKFDIRSPRRDHASPTSWVCVYSLCHWGSLPVPPPRHLPEDRRHPRQDGAAHEGRRLTAPAARPTKLPHGRVRLRSRGQGFRRRHGAVAPPPRVVAVQRRRRRRGLGAQHRAHVRIVAPRTPRAPGCDKGGGAAAVVALVVAHRVRPHVPRIRRMLARDLPAPVVTWDVWPP